MVLAETFFYDRISYSNYKSGNATLKLLATECKTRKHLSNICPSTRKFSKRKAGTPLSYGTQNITFWLPLSLPCPKSAFLSLLCYLQCLELLVKRPNIFRETENRNMWSLRRSWGNINSFTHEIYSLATNSINETFNSWLSRLASSLKLQLLMYILYIYLNPKNLTPDLISEIRFRYTKWSFLTSVTPTS